MNKSNTQAGRIGVNPLVRLQWRAGWLALLVLLASELLQWLWSLPACPLCVLQRWLLGCFVLVVWLWFWHRPTAQLGHWLYLIVCFIASSSGLGVAMRQVWLVHGPKPYYFSSQCLSGAHRALQGGSTWSHTIVRAWRGGRTCIAGFNHGLVGALPIASLICFLLLSYFTVRMIMIVTRGK